MERIKLCKGLSGYLLIFLASITWMGCGFQSRKYTQGHYWESWSKNHDIEPIPHAANVQNVNKEISASTEEYSVLLSDPISSSLGLNEIDHNDFSSHEKCIKLEKDTTIKGEKKEKIHYPNQKEAPKSLSQPIEEAKTHVKHYFWLNTLWAAIFGGLYAALLQSTGDVGSAISPLLFVLGFLMVITFFTFRMKWKVPYQSTSEELKSYRKFNEKEKWYKEFENRIFSIDFLIVMGVVITLFAWAAIGALGAG
jgi:hypothetical protein